MNNIANAFKSMARNLSMTLASFFLVTLTLMVVGSILVLSLNTNYIATNVINNITITTFVVAEATPEESEAVGAEIEAIPGVKSVEFSSKEEELQDITSTFGEDSETIYEFYEPINPLSDAYIVTVDDSITDFEQINQQIEAIDNVDSSSYGEETTTDNFVQTMEIIQYISILFSIILAFVSLFIISNTIKLNITARYKEIEIMRLVGATKMYIRLPFVIEGLFIGCLGGILSAGILHFTYIQALQTEFLSLIAPSLLPSADVAMDLYIGLPVGGMFIGAIGSIFAIRKYLSK